MRNPIHTLEQILYGIREFLWNYPEYLFQDNIVYTYFRRVYRSSVPYSHFILAIVVMIISVLGLFTYSKGVVQSSRDIVFVEGIVMGVDEDGELQQINKINPLLPSNIQLEKDLTELIYEPLIQYEYVQNEDGTYEPKVQPVLVESVSKIKQGADYQFNLKQGVKWHDGKEFTADDVIKTLEIMSTVDAENAYIQAIKQLQWEKLGKYTIRICTKPIKSEDITCNERNDNPIFANFLELMTIKIIPEHKSGDINSNTANTSEPNLYRAPIGTGKYIFRGISEDNILLVKNVNYHERDEVPEIDRMEFKFYRDFDSAIQGVQNGDVHAFASLTTEGLREFSEYTQIQVIQSPVLYNQFWGMYFNLRTDPNGNTIGPEFLGDVNVRKAIRHAVNKDEIINETLNGVGKEAFGPIPEISEFFNTDLKEEMYDLSEANALLEEAGWAVRTGDTYRTNEDGEIMEFSLYYVNSYDRRLVAETIQANLAEIGINVIIDRSEQVSGELAENSELTDGWSLKALNEQVVAPRLFDVLLYGVNTFIDPDRFELYHSTQQQHPGLNIAGYTGSVETVKPREDRQEGESSLVRVPKVDRILEQTRGFDPDSEIDARVTNYNEFQTLLADDAPLVFLYHPQFIYYINSTITDVSLDNTSSLEDRFENISEWMFD